MSAVIVLNILTKTSMFNAVTFKSLVQPCDDPQYDLLWLHSQKEGLPYSVDISKIRNNPSNHLRTLGLCKRQDTLCCYKQFVKPSSDQRFTTRRVENLQLLVMGQSATSGNLPVYTNATRQNNVSSSIAMTVCTSVLTAGLSGFFCWWVIATVAFIVLIEGRKHKKWEFGPVNVIPRGLMQTNAI